MIEAQTLNGSCFAVDPVVNFDNVVLIEELTELAIVVGRDAIALVCTRRRMPSMAATAVDV